MPKQYTFMGKPIPQINPRRVAFLLASIAIFAVVTLVFTLPKAIPSGPSLSKFTENHHIPIPSIPKKIQTSILNPFHPSAHAPPAQENSTSGDSSWYSNWNWLSPFSSSVTLDERRSLLPPLATRPPVYTYYDQNLKRDEDAREAENELLLIWRRAWWAKGFKPSILGPAEAMRNARYDTIRKLNLGTDLQNDLQRWLAWEFMGSGILVDLTVLPMGSYEDALLKKLRAPTRDYPQLTRYDQFEHALLSGSRKEISAVLTAALSKPEFKNSRSMIEALPNDAFQVDPEPEGIASYSMATVSKKYDKVYDTFLKSRAEGLHLLCSLINAHLHSTWQSTFSTGIAVLKPSPKHMTAILEPALALASLLAECPPTPMPSSCPPNLHKCTPCMSTAPIDISTPLYYRNSSKIFTIGTVPHPYTYNALASLNKNPKGTTIDVPYVRRETIRDAWIGTTTKELLGTGVSSAPRVLKFKEAVAAPPTSYRTLWFTAERNLALDELNWYFGFVLPTAVPANSRGKSETPVPGPERRPRKPIPKGQEVLDDAQKTFERGVLKQAREFGQSKRQGDLRLKAAVESWNLADIEAWRFARAWMARSGVERESWEEEEIRAAGRLGIEKKDGSSRRWYFL